MSAIRNSSNRSEARKKRSTPYARGFIGTISRFFNYFTGNPTEQSTEPDDEDNNRRINRSYPNERQTFASTPKSDFSSGNRAPLTPSNAHNGSRSALPEPLSQPVPNTEQVASYFSQRMGARVTTNEVESMITNLQTTPEREKFKFTFTTPGPISSSSFSPSNVSSPAPPSPSPSKKLARNPNGVYRWEGGGSAKTPRQRNRFASPAFGASPLKTGRPTTQESPEQSRVFGQNTKRRKVDGASASDQSPSLNATTSNGVPFPNMSPSTPRTNGVLRQTSPLPSRLRTSAKPTAPLNPSPLRQAWSDASSTSSHEDNKPSQATKPTKAANLVAELIKETAPANKPDLSNPYQTASPVGKVGPPRRGTKRPRAVGRPPLPTKEQKAEEEKKRAEGLKRKEEEEKLKALSAQAIIEATLPKGSKRSRPPAHLENKPAGDAPRSPSPTPHVYTSSVPTETVVYTVEEVEDSRPKKRSRSSSEDSSQTKALLTDVTVEDLEDIDMDKEKGSDPLKSSNNTSQSSRSMQFQSFKPSSIPREPSKLRFSFQAESSSSSPTPVSTPIPLLPLSSEDQPPLVSTTVPPSIQVISNGFNFSFKSPPKEKVTKTEPPVHESTKSPDVETVKAQVRALDTKALPTFKLSLTGSTAFSGTPEHANARDAAKVIHFSSLPSFAFPSKNSFSSDSDPTNPKQTPTLPVKESSSGFKPIMASTTPSSKISGSLPSKPSLTPTVASTSLKSFDFTAAGMKPPSSAKDTWNCSHCGLSSPQDAMKCTICEEPKPDSIIPTPPVAPPSITAVASEVQPVKSFDWASAGLKAPTASKDAWNCGLCGLSNLGSTAKCTICNEPKLGPTISTPPAVPSVVAPEAQPVKSFDWTSAGLKAPTASKDTWDCGVCGLSSPRSAAKCTICDHDPHGTASSTTGSATSAKQAMSTSNMLVQQASKSIPSSSARGLDVGVSSLEDTPSKPGADSTPK